MTINIIIMTSATKIYSYGRTARVSAGGVWIHGWPSPTDLITMTVSTALLSPVERCPVAAVDGL